MTQWYEHTGLSFLLLIHDFDHRILSTISLSNLSPLSYAKRFTNKLGNHARIASDRMSISSKRLFNSLSGPGRGARRPGHQVKLKLIRNVGV